MSLSINYSKYKFNLFSLRYPPFLLPYLLMRAFVCQPVSRDRGAGAGWLTIGKRFLILIKFALRSIYQPFSKSCGFMVIGADPSQVFLSGVCFTNPFKSRSISSCLAFGRVFCGDWDKLLSAV